MITSLLATSSIAAATTGHDVTSIVFIAGAGLMVGALLYATFTTGALNFDDHDAPDAAADRAATAQRGDSRQ